MSLADPGSDRAPTHANTSPVSVIRDAARGTEREAMIDRALEAASRWAWHPAWHGQAVAIALIAVVVVGNIGQYL